MRKKIIKMVFPVLFAGLGLTGCSETEGVLPQEPGSSTGETGYLSLNFAHAGIETKATDEDYGIQSEYKVESVRVVLYRAKDGIAAYSFDIDATNTGGDELFKGEDVASVTSPGSRRFTTKAKEVEMDDYYVLALLNYPAEVEAITREGNHYDDFGNAILTLANDYTKLIGVSTPRYSSGNTAQYKFFMSNFKKDFVVEGKRVLYETEAAAEANPVNIIVDRAVAKVTLKQDSLQVVNGSVENIVWKLDITNKQTYWVRHAAKMLDGQWEPRSEMDRTVLYAEDPNFDNISQARNPSISISPKQYFNYITTDNLVADGAPWEYVTENTMEGAEQWQDVTTRMVIKLNYIPDGFSAGESYYWWRGYALSVEDIKNYAEDITSIPTELSGLEQPLLALKSKNYNFNEPTKTNHPEIEFYQSGLSYFATPIRHFNDVQAPDRMQYGRYGVVRNNLYTLNLKKISGPGSPDIPDPDEENDEEPQYISLDIQIQNWYSRDTQNIEE